MKIPSATTRAIVLAVLFSGMPLASLSQAANVVDQNNITPFGQPGDSGLLADQWGWQEQVTAGVSGKLVGVELNTLGAYGTFQLFLAYGLGTQYVSAPAYSVTATVTGNVTTVDVSAANFTLVPGEKFLIGLENAVSPYPLVLANGGNYGNNLYQFEPGDPLIAPQLSSYYAPYPSDLEFATIVATPEPSSIVMSTLGLASLALIAWRRHVRRKIA